MKHKTCQYLSLLSFSGQIKNTHHVIMTLNQHMWQKCLIKSLFKINWIFKISFANKFDSGVTFL